MCGKAFSVPLLTLIEWGYTPESRERSPYFFLIVARKIRDLAHPCGTAAKSGRQKPDR